MNTDQKFLTGDIIRQTFQTDAKGRLVVSTTDDPDLVVVWDQDTKAYRRVLSWGHTLVKRGTVKSIEEALAHRSSDAYITTKRTGHW
jgi:hypothetical protein